MLKLDLHPDRLAVGNVGIHYGWVIVVVAAGMRLSASAVRSSFSILVPRLVESFGWSHGIIGFSLALQWAFSGIFGPAAGWLGDRYGVRRTMLLGALVFTVAMVLTSRMTEFWQLYLYYGVLLSFAMAIFQVPLTAAVTMWFQRNLGLGMGILQSSQGVGPLVFVPLVLFIISWFGDSESALRVGQWVTGVQAEGQEAGLRAAFWVTGIGGGLALTVFVKFFYDEPAQIGLRPYGATGDEPIRRVHHGETAQIRTKVFLNQAKHTSAFWNLIGIHFWGCAGHAILVVFLVAIAEERGLSKGSAAGVFVVMSVVSTLTRFGVPIAADKFGSKGVMAVCFFMQCAPLILLFFAHDVWLFYLFAVLFGIGFGGEMSAFPIINRQYYGSAPIGTTYGWQMMGSGVGMAAGAIIGGTLRNLTGDFDVTILASLALSGIGVATIYLLPSTSHHLLPDWEEALPQEARSSG
jgi:MFS family permease